MQGAADFVGYTRIGNRGAEFGSTRDVDVQFVTILRNDGRLAVAAV
jgi:hypothetical protein